MNCPKCGKPGRRNLDEWVCFEHSSFGFEAQAWDSAGRGGTADVELRDKGLGRRRRYEAKPPGLPWTPAEIETFETWKEGDEIPEALR